MSRLNDKELLDKLQKMYPPLTRIINEGGFSTKQRIAIFLVVEGLTTGFLNTINAKLNKVLCFIGISFLLYSIADNLI